MDTLTSKRIAKLDAVSNCPTCGAKRGLSLGGKKNRKVAFDCGAIFHVYPGHAIASLLGCPAPSIIAAELLDLEIIQDDHVALVKAGTA